MILYIYIFQIKIHAQNVITHLIKVYLGNLNFQNLSLKTFLQDHPHPPLPDFRPKQGSLYETNPHLKKKNNDLKTSERLACKPSAQAKALMQARQAKPRAQLLKAVPKITTLLRRPLEQKKHRVGDQIFSRIPKNIQDEQKHPSFDYTLIVSYFHFHLRYLTKSTFRP